MNYPLISLQLFLICIGGLLWTTMPDDPIPNLLWRLHYCGAQWLFGIAFGIGIGLWLAHKLGHQ